jgi:hypothetical protein
LRFRQAMRCLIMLAGGHQALVNFWADYEVCVCGGEGGGLGGAVVGNRWGVTLLQLNPTGSSGELSLQQSHS